MAKAPAPAPIAADEGMGNWQTRHTTGGPSPSALSNGGTPRYPATTTSASPAATRASRPCFRYRGRPGRPQPPVASAGPGTGPRGPWCRRPAGAPRRGCTPGPRRAEPGPVRRPRRPGLDRPVYVIAATRRRADRTGVPSPAPPPRRLAHTPIVHPGAIFQNNEAPTIRTSLDLGPALAPPPPPPADNSKKRQWPAWHLPPCHPKKPQPPARSPPHDLSQLQGLSKHRVAKTVAMTTLFAHGI